ncbi:RNA polymerase sigma factor [Pimelobacter simplex]|uniref:RNA polymerase sigma factor n=1 Tax=Nocardioides simplex TaxID=2045 RepID=UPI001931E9CF|nr:sigma-70 family RNA polymerase sigma factor [Pimelobacter simplex]
MGTRPVRADDELVTAAKSGDAAAWRELYRDHAGRLLLWLEARSTPGGEAADDIAAATWLVAAERIADFHGNGSDFGGWLFGIARKHKANAGRRTATRTKGFDTLAADAEQTVAGPETGILADEWVRQALAALPPRERDVIACTEVLDLDVSSTAAALGMTAVAVRVARHRGLKRLRAHLASD